MEVNDFSEAPFEPYENQKVRFIMWKDDIAEEIKAQKSRNRKAWLSITPVVGILLATWDKWTALLINIGSTLAHLFSAPKG